MKVTLITVCFKSAAVLRSALESVLSQHGVTVDYIVVDGGSSDGTVELLKEYEAKFRGSGLQTACEEPDSAFRGSGLQTACEEHSSFRFISEPDRGMYDALNKGLRLATGDVVGILNADDVLAADDTLAQVAAAFAADPTLDGTYGDVRFVKEEHPPLIAHTSSLNTLRKLPTVRYCSGKRFRPWMFRFGTQTAHPSTFFRKSCFERWGDYSLDYGMYADFDLLLRFIWKHRAKMRYLPLCTTVMRTGGASTDGWRTTLKINRTDRRIVRDNGYYTNYLFLYARYLFKVWGFVFRQKGVHGNG